MGAKKANLAKFLTNHPVCYVCGIAPSTTKDHVPAQVCFVNRESPEGYVFPACADCNAKDRKSEQVVAFHIHAISGHANEFSRTYSGLKNNSPSALPNPYMSLGEKAKALSARGITLPASQIPLAPVVKVAPETHDHFHRFGRKLGKALYYKVMGQPTPPDFRIITNWLVADMIPTNEIISTFINIMPNLKVGNRVNVDIGDQFGYRYNVTRDGDVMIQTSNFNNKIFITSFGAQPNGVSLEFDRFLEIPGWKEII
ncbi:MAG: hypothetical protein AB1429_07475 [Pseudomonadota bacterium]